MSIVDLSTINIVTISDFSMKKKMSLSGTCITVAKNISDP